MGSDKERPARTDAVRRASSRAARVVAWVDVRADSANGTPTDASLGAHLLHQVTRAVRGDDRVCPVATSLVAVVFGSVASAVPLTVLGDRIARAVGPAVPFDRSDGGLATSVGMAGPVEGIEPDDVTRRSLGAARTGRMVLGLRCIGRLRRADGGRHRGPAGDRPPVAAAAPLRPLQPLHRRSVHRYCATRAERHSGAATGRTGNARRRTDRRLTGHHQPQHPGGRPDGRRGGRARLRAWRPPPCWWNGWAAGRPRSPPLPTSR